MLPQCMQMQQRVLYFEFLQQLFDTRETLQSYASFVSVCHIVFQHRVLHVLELGGSLVTREAGLLSMHNEAATAM